MLTFRTAPWDSMAKFGTVLLFIILLLVGLSAGRVAQLRFFIVAFLSVLAIGTYAFAPRHYVIDNEGIKINRLLGNVIIPYTDIKLIEQVDDYFLSRWAGSGGTFGYYGAWENKNGEKVNVYTTRLDHLVLIMTDKAIFALTPDNEEYFIETVQSHLHDKNRINTNREVII